MSFIILVVRDASWKGVILLGVGVVVIEYPRPFLWVDKREVNIVDGVLGPFPQPNFPFSTPKARVPAPDTRCATLALGRCPEPRGCPTSAPGVASRELWARGRRRLLLPGPRAAEGQSVSEFAR